MNHADFDVDSTAAAVSERRIGSPNSSTFASNESLSTESRPPESLSTESLSTESVSSDVVSVDALSSNVLSADVESTDVQSTEVVSAGVLSVDTARDRISMLVTEPLNPHPTLWQFDIDSSMRVVDARAPTLCTSVLLVNASEQGVSVGHPALDVQIRDLVVGAFDGRSRQTLLESARGSGCRLMAVARHLGAVVRLELLDLDAQLRFPEALLIDLFSLTHTESVIVRALLNGQTLREYAEQNGVSRNTVRTHLKSVFMKTRTHRQADLVKLVQLVCMSYSHHSDER